MLMTPLDLEITWSFPGKHDAIANEAHLSVLLATVLVELLVAVQPVSEAWEATTEMNDSKATTIIIFYLYLFDLNMI